MKIIYEDDQILVVYKEAGLPVESARLGVKDLVGTLKTYLREKNPQAGMPYLGLVHRLDQPVEGILVLAKTQKAAADLSLQAQNKDGMEKIYRASVRMDKKDQANVPAKGHLTDYLLRDGKTNSSRVVSKDTRGSKRAELEYEILEVKEREDDPQALEALLQIKLLTGRHHQIRVQLSHAKLPLYGDRKYGAVDNSRRFPALCAYKLTLRHPMTGKSMSFCVDDICKFQ